MQLRGVDTNLIVALSALLEQRSVTRAAKIVGLGQSSMSHTLARLRAHFDDPLLVKVGRELVLTDRAKSLIEPVAEAVATLERVFRQVEHFDPRTSLRVFRIAATDNLEFYLLPKLASLLHKSAPGVQVRVCALPADWTHALERGDIDLKLGRKYRVPSSLESEDLSHEVFACVVRRMHAAPARPTLEEYAALEHMIVTPTAGPADEPSSLIDSRLGQQGLRRRIVLSVPHFLVAPFVVASSDLVLTAPARLVKPFVKSLGLRRLELPIKQLGYTLSQVWASRANEDPGQRWLRTTIAKILAQK
jgi:DNA-binding transcriptional LysR family regulator